MLERKIIIRVSLIIFRLVALLAFLLIFQESIIEAYILKETQEPIIETGILKSFQKFITIPNDYLPDWRLFVLAFYIGFEILTIKSLSFVKHLLTFSSMACIVSICINIQFEPIGIPILGLNLNYLSCFSCWTILMCIIYIFFIDQIQKYLSQFIDQISKFCKSLERKEKPFPNNKKQDLQKGFIVDDPLDSDNYNNEAGKLLANLICDNIVTTTNNQSSFGIGIEGEWGSGKTSFISKLEGSAKEKGLLITHFKPYLLPNTKLFEEELMATIAKEFNSPEVNDLLSNYWKAFERLSSPTFQFFYILFNKGQTIHEQYQNISKYLQKKRKKLVIIIDDIDRLDSDTLPTLLRLLKQTTGFPNIFFVFAYDKTIIEKLLKKIDSNEKTFLEKIITFNYSLPQVPSLKLKSIFKKLQEEYLQQNQLIKDFNLIGNDYKNLFLNPRSIKRIINHYKISWELFNNTLGSLKEEERSFINKQLLVLSILHINFNKTYSKLKDGCCLKEKSQQELNAEEAGSSGFIIDDESFNNKEFNNIPDEFINSVTEVEKELLRLLNENNTIFYHKFINKNLTKKYFNSELDLNDIDIPTVKHNMGVLNDLFN